LPVIDSMSIRVLVRANTSILSILW